MRWLAHGDPGLDGYLARVQRLPTLSREQERVLARRYLEHGDQAAADELVLAHLRFVVHIAAGYRGYGFRMADLVEEGNVGLLEAVRRFDPQRGKRFMTYAAFWVRACILAYVLRSWSLVSVGLGPVQSRLFFRLQRERARLVSRLGEGAEVSKRLARRFGTNVERIRAMESRLDSRDLSLDGPAFREGQTSAIERLASETESQEEECARSEWLELVRQRVERAVGGLDERERLIARSRLLSDGRTTLAQVGRRLGLSRERVRQLEERIKGKLRTALWDLDQSSVAA